MTALSIDIWSDIACPWCYVGKRRLEAALETFGEDVEIEWHSFELDPATPAEVDLGGATYADRLARKYNVSVERGQTMIDTMTQTASDDGLDFRFDKIRPGNTFDAHRVLHFAKTRGLQGALKERLLQAYLGEGELMSDHETLARLGADVGLEPDEIQAVLSSDAHAHEVRQDEAEAAAMGASGVPFFVIGGRYAVPGAQPAETILKVLERTKAELTPSIVEGAVCGPDGC